MRNKIKIGFLVSFGLLFFSGLFLNADGNQPLKLLGGRTFYASRPNKLLVSLGPTAAGKPFSWKLTYLNRTITAREAAVPNSGIVTLDVSLPKLNPGVIVTTELTVNCGKVEKKLPLFFYPPNPFELGKEQLKKLKIGVWCLDENTVLTDLLSKLKVPFEQVDDIGNYSGKVLLVTGMDFSEYSGIEETLFKLSKNGTRIIISAPLGGSLPLKTSACQRLVFEHNDIISKINKKFDVKYWGAKSPASRGIKPVPYDDGIALQITDGASQFSYCKIGVGKGSIIITTWNLAGKAKDSPTPLYLLDSLIRK